MLTQFLFEKEQVAKETDGGTIENVLELLRLGYVVDTVAQAHSELVKVVKDYLGDVEHLPFDINHGILNKDSNTRLIEQITHYWTGQLPNDAPLARAKLAQVKELKRIKVIKDVRPVYKTMITSKEVLSPKDIAYAKGLVHFYDGCEIPVKETMVVLEDVKFLKTTTDALRYIHYINGGQADLSDKVQYKKLLPLNLIERLVKEEDVRKHKAKWKILFRLLHTSTTKNRKKYPKCAEIADKIYNNKKLETTQGTKDVRILKSRPSEFARRILSLGMEYLLPFSEVVHKVPTKNLMQLYGACKGILNEVDHRAVIVKGGKQVQLEASKASRIAAEALSMLIEGTIRKRSTREEVVYIHPGLFKCPLPSGQRTANDNVVAAGTRLPITGECLRLFTYWKGRDIDLSASFLDEDFNQVDSISYQNLSHKDVEIATHSGDITDAPEGASEFVDIDLNTCPYRYAVMDVRIFSGHDSFEDMDEVFAGWMERDSLSSGEIYEPTQVKFKFDLTTKGKVCSPVLFDLVNREAIWMDGTRKGKLGTCVTGESAPAAKIAESLVSRRATIGELLFMQHKNVAVSPEDAEVVYDLDFCERINEINSKILVD